VSAPTIANSVLYGVTAVAANDAWAVGEQYDSGLSSNVALMEHWNGSTWSVVPDSPYGLSLRGVAAFAANDVWAVGWMGGYGFRPFTEHWDGSSWTYVESLASGGRRLYAVAGVGPADIWAVGQSISGMLIFHWNGSAWSPVSAPTIANSVLYGVTAVAANDAWAVGTANNGETVILHWDGSSWTRVASPNSGAYINVLTSVSAISASDVWAVGYWATSGVEYHGYTLHWDGVQWTATGNPTAPDGPDDPTPAGTYLYNVATAANGEGWAVGRNLQTAGATSVTLHLQGGTWTRVASPNPGYANSNLYGVSAPGPAGVWAVGNQDTSALGYTYPLIEHYSALPCATATPGSPTAVPSATPVRPTASTVASATTRPATATPIASVPPVPSATAPPVASATSAPGATATPDHGCQFAILSFHSCLDGAGCADYAIPLQNTGDTALTVDGIVRLQARGGREIGRVAIPPTTLAAHSTTSALGRVCGVVNPGEGPFQLIVQIQDVARTCEAKTARQPVPLCAQEGTPRAFTDMPPANPFYPYVAWMSAHGEMSGYACGGLGEPCNATNDPYLRGAMNVTRGQLMKMVVTASAWPGRAAAQPHFADVPGGDPFYGYIETAAAMGIISGYSCGGPGEPCDAQNRPYFRAGAPITRGQLSKVLALAWEFASPAPITPTFADVTANDPFYGYIETMAQYGVVGGYSCGGPGEPCDPLHRPYFRTFAYATRAQVAKFVAVAYGGR
ncbi:MAG TPA: S-layer homology domain-containing protein, partial [Chloroflexia bacterium]|nr:S-layer homology domain-containing protein [Chloroflexia bacterium]